MMPNSDLSNTQFGFRSSRGTSFACNLLNDVRQFFRNQGSPLYICSLDAEKCFDRIWHDGLFYKLLEYLPLSYWRFLLTWYRNLNAVIRWKNRNSAPILITRGTRQGSILSPVLFNLFINDLLESLQSLPAGISIGHMHLNSFAYADDISLFSATVTGLQLLINKCTQYAEE